MVIVLKGCKHYDFNDNSNPEGRHIPAFGIVHTFLQLRQQALQHLIGLFC
jgi:hypothetical protein